MSFSQKLPSMARIARRSLYQCLVANTKNTFSRFPRNDVTALTFHRVSQPSINLLPCAMQIRGIKTEAEQELSDFLRDEIDAEQKIIVDIPEFEDFKVSSKGTQMLLTKNFQGETISVSFDINENENVSEGEGDEEGAVSDEMQSEVVSYPNFKVEIEKKSSTLAFNCSFSDTDNTFEEDQMAEENNSEFDTIKIDHVTVTHDSSDGLYEAETTNMDNDLYGMLMQMLMERGVNVNFANQLLEFSTSVEHRHYIKFLKDLKKFVDVK